MSETIRHFEVAWETGSRRLSKCIVGLFWRHDENASPTKRSHNALDNHLDPVSRATSKWRIVALFFPPPWWHEVHIFPSLTPVAQVAVTVCIFPRKREPVARFTALNNLPFHHRSPAIEPCYKFPCASNRLHRLHIAHGTGHTFFALCFIIGLPVRATFNQE